MSQISDIYASSTADTLNYLPSDDQLCTPDPYSQQTNTSVSDLDFLQPLQPPPIPESLQRVGPTRKKTYILYSDMTNDEFVDWWLRTGFGIKKKMRWDSKHQSEAWTYFDQVAHATNGEPKVMCKRCGKIMDHPQCSQNGTSTMMKHIKGVGCQNSTIEGAKQPAIKYLIKDATRNCSNTQVFSQEAWEKKLIRFITVSRLPFQLIEHPDFHDLIHMAQLAPSKPEIPSAKTIRHQLQDAVKEQQKDLLQMLPPDAKLSVALDCWTSPFQQAFMAVTGYFLDQDWNYHEILLGFEPLHGTHTGANLSTVVLNLLQQHQIANRVLAITTDNVSNNSTMMLSIQESLKLVDLGNNTPIIRIPCIAHIIQLSLNQLLGKMKATPKNEAPEMDWSEARSQSLRARQHGKEIVDTLNKIRSLAIFIKASPQRQEAFCKLQTESSTLVPIQDVRTRWNSTFLMLRRAKRLQSTLDKYCSEYDHPHMMLDYEEWRQIEYLLWITQPFYQLTTALSKTKDITIHIIFGVYNKLFDHLETSIQLLKQKKVPWKQVMLTALEAAKSKLSEYYSKTDDIDGDLFAIGTILAPQNKLHFFSGSDWDKSWRERYRKSFKDYFEQYKKYLSDKQISSHTELSVVQTSEIEMLLAPKSYQSEEYNEVTQYLESGTVQASPRSFWKDHEQEFPVLASLARDILSMPATGAGVERLFNSARDICHYRRGSLNATTIQDLMMFMCTSRFDIEEEQLAFIREYLSDEEIQAAGEEKDAQGRQDTLDPISDDEDNDSVFVQEQSATEVISQRALGKRRKSIASEPDEDLRELVQSDDEAEHALPNTQQCASRRHRKRPKLLDDYELGRP